MQVQQLDDMDKLSQDNAETVILSWQRRLVAMAQNPPYVFCDTPQHLIWRFQQRKTTFAGYSEQDVAEAEVELGVEFPMLFRTFLRKMAKAPGALFGGFDLAGIKDFKGFHADALALLAETDPGLSLPAKAVVFQFLQGYTFSFILATGGFDGPVMGWMETEKTPAQLAPTFEKMVEAHLRLMESNDRDTRERGGEYLTLYPDGGTKTSIPSIASGERPLDIARAGKKWWQIFHKNVS